MALFDSVSSYSDDPNNINVWLRGGHTQYDTGAVLEGSGVVIDALHSRDIPPENIDIQWDNTPGISSVDMQINSRGRFESNMTYWQRLQRLSTEAILSSL
jgi:hypothetical protein